MWQQDEHLYIKNIMHLTSVITQCTENWSYLEYNLNNSVQQKLSLTFVVKVHVSVGNYIQEMTRKRNI